MEKKTRNCYVSYHHERDHKYIPKLRTVITVMKVSDYLLEDDIGHLTDDTIYKKFGKK
jgi:hypothetical protein